MFEQMLGKLQVGANRIRNKIKSLPSSIDLTRLQIEENLDDRKFKLKVRKDKRIELTNESNQFSGEVLDFLRTDTTTKLKVINPNNNQLMMVYEILSSVENGSHLFNKAVGDTNRVLIDGPAMMIKHTTRTERGDDYSTAVYWDVNSDSPFFFVFSDDGSSKIASLSFLILPELAENPKQVEGILNWIGFADGSLKVGVYKNGERLTFNSESQYKGVEYSTTEQYYLVGSFYGESGENYVLYGKNDDIHRKTSKRDIGEGSLQPQAVEIKS